MYENITYEDILQRMLDRVPDDMDKREGSIIYDALAPAAAEMQNMYIQLDTVLNETFADSQSRDYLIRRCGERGIQVEEATYAIRQGEFNMDVPVGARFSLKELNYKAVEKIDDGIYKLQCETPGYGGNVDSGSMVPIDYIEGLETAVLTDVLVPGEDEEDTEHLRKRYYASLNAQAFGGNITDYKEKVNALDGVGGVKVYPVWNGGGTVKLVIIDSTYARPSNTLVEAVQEAIDPVGSQGKGAGIAPIGHIVTVTDCKEIAVNINIDIVMQEGWNWESLEPYVNGAIDGYFRELAASWADEEALIVRISQIETRLLDLAGVLDISGTTLNGAAQNLVLSADNIPIRGVVTHV